MQTSKKEIADTWRNRRTLLVPWRGASTSAKRQKALGIALATVLDRDTLIEEQVFFLNEGQNPKEVALPTQQSAVGTLRNKQRNRAAATPAPSPVNGEVLQIDSYAVFSAASAAGTSYIQGDELKIHTTPFGGLVVEGVRARAWQGCCGQRRGIILRVALADDQQRLLNTAPFYFIHN